MDTGEARQGMRKAQRCKGANIRDEIGLELVEIDVKGSIKSKRSSDRRNNLGNKTIEVGKAGRGNSKLRLADIVNSLVVDLENGANESLIRLRPRWGLTMKEQSECSRVVWVVNTEL